MASPAKNAGHASLVKEKINGRTLCKAFKLTEHMKISLHGNSHSPYGNTRFPANVLKALQLPAVRASGTNIHAALFLRINHRIIGNLVSEAVRNLPGRQSCQLLSPTAGKPGHPGGTHIDGKHQQCRL